MYKAAIEIGRISKLMIIKFCIYIEGDEVQQAKNSHNRSNNIIYEFNFKGTDYLNISPKPFVSIDISPCSRDKNDSWCKNMTLTLNRYCLCDFLEKLKKMIEYFKVKDLYYLNDGKLCIDKSLAEKMSQIVRTPTQAVKLSHGIIYDAENKEISYEGIYLMINSPDYYCPLTYQELKYLYYTLSKIDMNALSLQLINTYLLVNLSNNLKENKTSEDEKTRTFSEIKEKEVIEEPLPPIKENVSIPDDI